MTFAQALAYFSREAFVNLLRGWKVSLLAVLTIAFSLFLGGIFLLIGSNLQGVIQSWERESKIIIYLEHGSTVENIEILRKQISEAPWVEQIEKVSAKNARKRFLQAFPSMIDLLNGWEEEPLPGSLEISIDWKAFDQAAASTWLSNLRAEPAVDMIDDDRDWLGQIRAAVLILQSLGTIFGGVLLGTAVFTIASIIRLTAYLYRDEIAVMRQVGATEFFIRGPFYVEGLYQGLAGGFLAVLALSLSYVTLVDRYQGSLITSVLASDFLSFGELLSLVILGGAAGLIGAIASLRRETLRTEEKPEDWTE